MRAAPQPADSRAHREDAAGTALGGLVTALALLASATGFCTGCEAYKLGYLFRGHRFVTCPLPQHPAPGGRSF